MWQRVEFDVWSTQVTQRYELDMKNVRYEFDMKTTVRCELDMKTVSYELDVRTVRYTFDIILSIMDWT